MASRLSLGQFHKQMASRPFCLLAILLCCSSASPSPLADQQLHAHSIVPRRLLLSKSSQLAATGSDPFFSSSSSSSPSVRLEMPQQPPQKNGKRAILWTVELIAGVVTGISLGVAVVALLLFMGESEEEEKKSPPIFGYTMLDPEIEWGKELSFLWKDDPDLPPMDLIGRGACGVVYRVEVPNSEGAVVAVKRVDKPAVGTARLCREDQKHLLDEGMRQIRSEIMTAGFLRHPNILPVLAHVYRCDRHYLVYEYMGNGSLQGALWEGGRREMGWQARLQVARGVAAGLEYLHLVHRPAVIHRDLKPANILLDKEMKARIADFGLAKEDDDGVGLTTSHVAGTLGYIAPEYYQVMRFTDKCDVYSFGLILAALVTGRLPTDKFFQRTDEMCMTGWLRNAMRSGDSATVAVDKTLLGNGFEAQMVLALKVACFCTYDDPKRRPNMRDVRCMLSQIKS